MTSYAHRLASSNQFLSLRKMTLYAVNVSDSAHTSSCEEHSCDLRETLMCEKPLCLQDSDELFVFSDVGWRGAGAADKAWHRH